MSVNNKLHPTSSLIEPTLASFAANAFAVFDGYVRLCSILCYRPEEAAEDDFYCDAVGGEALTLQLASAN